MSADDVAQEDGGQRMRMAQYGTRHDHATGVLRVMLDSPEVEVVGVYEPDRSHREMLQASGSPPWSQVRWFDDKEEMLQDPTIVAISSEGLEEEGLDFTEEIIAAGKHAFYDKPAGHDYAHFERIVAMARERGLLIQLGYMFRNNDGFERITAWARSGFFGHVFGVRAYMSGNLSEAERSSIATLGYVDSRLPSKGGLFYIIGCHVLDQVVWILGRPRRVTGFLRHDIFGMAGFKDNTLGVFEYDDAMALVLVSAKDPTPGIRRFEVYGTEGSATMEPLEPADTLRLYLDQPRDGYPAGDSIVKLEARPRYVASLTSFLKDVRGEKQPDRSLDHELLVQETLLRATGDLPG